MKIGILSMQKVMNYGSFLQAYALKKTIEDMGHTVSYVDIRGGRDLFGSERTKSEKNRYVIDRYIMWRVEHVLFRWRRKKRFLNEFFPFLGADKPVEEAQCDMLVIGSDEVFNCCQPTGWGFSKQLLGETSCPAISYAACFGQTDFDTICSFGIEQEVALALKNIRKTSVRDENSVRCMERLTGVIPQQHVDPVLLYSWDSEIQPQTKLKNYILVYAYDNRIHDPAEIRTIKAVAKKLGKRVISCGVYQRWCDKNKLCTPFELLSYFDAADYVITDTFHGAVVSMNRNKPFAAIIRDSNRNKLSDLLTKFDMNSRKVSNIEDLESVLLAKIDYGRVNEKIAKEREKAILYLKENLK